MIKDIIIEGPDRTGKSTQVANLWTYYNNHNSDGCNIIRGDKMQSSVVDDVKNHQFLYTNSITKSFRDMKIERDLNLHGVKIYDRLHLSEIVYGKKYRNYSTEHIYKIEKGYISEYENVFLILLIDKVKNLVKRDDKKGLTSDPNEINAEIKDFTDAYYNSIIINKKMININGKCIKQVFNEIIEFTEGVD